MNIELSFDDFTAVFEPEQAPGVVFINDHFLLLDQDGFKLFYLPTENIEHAFNY